MKWKILDFNALYNNDNNKLCRVPPAPLAWEVFYRRRIIMYAGSKRLKMNYESENSPNQKTAVGVLAA